jgi:hypothetical protein
LDVELVCCASDFELVLFTRLLLAFVVVTGFFLLRRLLVIFTTHGDGHGKMGDGNGTLTRLTAITGKHKWQTANMGNKLIISQRTSTPIHANDSHSSSTIDRPHKIFVDDGDYHYGDGEM